MADRRLRVGVPAGLGELPAHTGAGRVWEHGLRLLRRHARVSVRDPARRGLGRRAPEVWLSDGHMGPLETREPFVVHLHEASFADPELRPLIAPEFLALYERPTAEAAQRAAAVITVSESSRRQIVESYGVAPERVHVAHLGVDRSVYQPQAAARAPKLLTRAGIDPDRPYVLFVSQLHPRKNLAALRDALGAIAGRGPAPSLVLVGHDPADRPDSAAIVAEAIAPIPGVPVARIEGPGDADVAALMAGAACLCLPSLMEGFGLAVLEALSCGAPVVVSDRGALPEVVGEAGVVVTPDGEGVERGLARVLSDPAEAGRLRAAGLRRAASLSWEAMAERWYAVLRDAAHGPD